MSEIDVQNAKQIRDPMDVLIKMEVPEDVSVAYSGYSSSTKVSDAVLDERSWPMRVLADLQGDGFPLNGSCQLYDSTVEASAANGKVGIRGNVGEDLSITITGDGIINGMSIMASGTNTVRFNGQTATIVGGQVIIPVGTDSITLEFPPLETDERAEVSLAIPGTSIQVDNDSLISCVVSLRSDLSVENPTLPESEINIDIYNDIDISEVVASIPEDTPLTYSAGYVGDMSQERQFYLSDQITWADNILSIHAVDAVHFLEEYPEPFLLLNSAKKTKSTLDHITAAIAHNLQTIGFDIMPQTSGFYGAYYSNYYNDFKGNIIMPRETIRKMLAYWCNVFRIENIPSDASSSQDETYWPAFVDAGIPSITMGKPSAKWDIQEEDCGDESNASEPNVSQVNVPHKNTQWLNGKGESAFGNISWVKDQGAFIDMSGLSYIYAFEAENVPIGGKTYWASLLPSSTTVNGGPSSTGAASGYVNDHNGIMNNFYFGRFLIDENSAQKIPSNNNGIMFTQVIDWSFHVGTKTQKKVWDDLVTSGYIEKDDTTINLYANGEGVIVTDDDKTYSTGGKGIQIDIEELINGVCNFADPQGNVIDEAFPKMAYKALLNRSRSIGSFTWKGDPRMQPRDVVNFHRLDGSVETITLENITLHHEGGGTYAEITYRKGIC